MPFIHDFPVAVQASVLFEFLTIFELGVFDASMGKSDRRSLDYLGVYPQCVDLSITTGKSILSWATNRNLRIQDLLLLNREDTNTLGGLTHVILRHLKTFQSVKRLTIPRSQPEYPDFFLFLQFLPHLESIRGLEVGDVEKVLELIEVTKGRASFNLGLHSSYSVNEKIFLSTMDFSGADNYRVYQKLKGFNVTLSCISTACIAGALLFIHSLNSLTLSDPSNEHELLSQEQCAMLLSANCLKKLDISNVRITNDVLIKFLNRFETFSSSAISAHNGGLYLFKNKRGCASIVEGVVREISHVNICFKPRKRLLEAVGARFGHSLKSFTISLMQDAGTIVFDSFFASCRMLDDLTIGVDIEYEDIFDEDRDDDDCDLDSDSDDSAASEFDEDPIFYSCDLFALPAPWQQNIKTLRVDSFEEDDVTGLMNCLLLESVTMKLKDEWRLVNVNALFCHPTVTRLSILNKYDWNRSNGELVINDFDPVVLEHLVTCIPENSVLSIQHAMKENYEQAVLPSGARLWQSLLDNHCESVTRIELSLWYIDKRHLDSILLAAMLTCTSLTHLAIKHIRQYALCVNAAIIHPQLQELSITNLIKFQKCSGKLIYHSWAIFKELAALIALMEPNISVFTLDARGGGQQLQVSQPELMYTLRRVARRNPLTALTVKLPNGVDMREVFVAVVPLLRSCISHLQFTGESKLLNADAVDLLRASSLEPREVQLSVEGTPQVAQAIRRLIDAKYSIRKLTLEVPCKSDWKVEHFLRWKLRTTISKVL